MEPGTKPKLCEPQHAILHTNTNVEWNTIGQLEYSTESSKNVFFLRTKNLCYNKYKYKKKYSLNGRIMELICV